MSYFFGLGKASLTFGLATPRPTPPSTYGEIRRRVRKVYRNSPLTYRSVPPRSVDGPNSYVFVRSRTCERAALTSTVMLRLGVKPTATDSKSPA